MTARLVIVDSNPILRVGLREILCSTTDVVVIGEASRCSEGCPLIARLQPDLVVFDLELDDACGGTVIKRFRERFPSLRAVIYTARRDAEFVAEALSHNIQGYVLKSSPNTRLVDAVEHAASGRGFLDPEITATVLTQAASVPPQRAGVTEQVLTAREMTILRLLAEGKRNKQIASQLGITERTVKYHVSGILSRLEAKNRTQAAKIAEKLGLLSVGANSGNSATLSA